MPLDGISFTMQSGVAFRITVRLDEPAEFACFKCFRWNFAYKFLGRLRVSLNYFFCCWAFFKTFFFACLLCRTSHSCPPLLPFCIKNSSAVNLLYTKQEQVALAWLCIRHTNITTNFEGQRGSCRSDTGSRCTSTLDDCRARNNASFERLHRPGDKQLRPDRTS